MILTPYHCSIHTHATLCDGKSTLEEMVAAAYAAAEILRKHIGSHFVSQQRSRIRALENVGRME